MKTGEFLKLLDTDSNKSLLFEYQPKKSVGANYHITEVKNVTVDTVDCGANTDLWRETVIQLWESPAEANKKDYMTAGKAKAILNKVDGIKPMKRDAELKIEYGNPEFHTAQLFIQEVEATANELKVKLVTEKTRCKAQETCGISSVQVLEKTMEGCCTPTSGCC